MKRLLITLALCFSLSACNDSDSGSGNNGNNTQQIDVSGTSCNAVTDQVHSLNGATQKQLIMKIMEINTEFFQMGLKNIVHCLDKNLNINCNAQDTCALSKK